MWKKDEPTPDGVAAPPPVVPATSAPVPAAPRAAAATERATIGKSIAIRGEVTGDEDLLIQGRIDGSVDLKQHAVTVGREGEVKASIAARVITIEGRVEGDLRGEEQVVLRSSAQVQGDISAPRVVLEDGARFRGGIDMGEVLAPAGGASAGKASAAARGSAPVLESAASSGGVPGKGPGESLTAGKGEGTGRKPAEVSP